MPDSLPQLVIAFLAVFVYVWLALRRFHFYRAHIPSSIHRLFMVDLLLVLASVEIFCDTVADAIGSTSTLGATAFVFAVVIRGALIAGGLALLLSMRTQG